MATGRLSIKRLLAPKSYSNKHRILEVLTKQFNDNNHPNCDYPFDLELDYAQLKEHGNLSTEDLVKEIPYLVKSKEVVEEEHNLGNYTVRATTDGVINANEEKYLKLGWSERRTEWSENFKLLTTPVIFLISLASFFLTVIFNNNNKNEIAKTKQEIQGVKDSLMKPDTPLKKFPK